MRNHAFTLIELLIVVLIIAILAAIAVPNFLEFQVRAKLARVKSDQRTLATAITAYTVDNNDPPLDINEYLLLFIRPKGLPDEMRYLAYTQLTTPIAYISSFMQDPFLDHRVMSDINRPLPEMRYYHFQVFDRRNIIPYSPALTANGFHWCLYSVGPAAVDRSPWPESYLQAGWPKADALNMTYDPSNGTVSFGRIHRTNKGILEGSSL